MQQMRLLSLDENARKAAFPRTDLSWLADHGTGPATGFDDRLVLAERLPKPH